jgi:hypothetical protein
MCMLVVSIHLFHIANDHHNVNTRIISGIIITMT